MESGRSAVLVVLLMMAAAASAASDDSDSMRAERLIGNIISSTTTVVSISTVSTTVPTSCLVSVFPTTACTGRRRKRRGATGPAAFDPPALTSSNIPTELHGSLQNPDETSLYRAQPDSVSSQRQRSAEPDKSRIFLYATRYVTVNNVVTSFTTLTNFSTTVSISLLCTAAGQVLLTQRCP